MKKLLSKLVLRAAVPIIIRAIVENTSLERLQGWVRRALTSAKTRVFRSSEDESDECLRKTVEDALEPLFDKLKERDVSEEEYLEVYGKVLDLIELVIIRSTFEYRGVKDDDIVLPIVRGIRKKLGIR